MTELPNVRFIAPVHLPEDRIAWRAGRYRELGHAAVVPLDIELVNLPAGAPRSLDSDAAVQDSIGYVRSVVERTEARRYAAVLPDCILDPSVEAHGAPAADDGPAPVFGITHLVAHHLASFGRRFSAVTRNRPIADELARKLDEYGLAALFAGTDVIDGAIDLVSDHDEWNRRLDAVTAQPRARSAGTVFNGCSAVDVADPVMNGVTVLDPTPLALDLLGIGLTRVVSPALRTPLGLSPTTR
jgi:Asp/Glu/hydantoin racemase